VNTGRGAEIAMMTEIPSVSVELMEQGCIETKQKKNASCVRWERHGMKMTLKNKLLRGENMYRTIKVTVVYDLDDPELDGLQINPKENVKAMVEREMIEVFGWDEGYRSIEVEVIDE
jgi:hypothetical protein